MSAETVRDARDRYLAQNGFSLASYHEPFVKLRAWKIPFAIPNTTGRKKIVPLHDLHHVATGYGTDWAGEAEIGAWELRAGCRSVAAYVLNGGAALIGLAIAPRRTIRAFRRARGQKTLYVLDKRPEDVLALTVEDLRDLLGVAPGGQAAPTT